VNEHLAPKTPAEQAPRLLSTEEAAEYLGVMRGTLEVWRCMRRYNLPFLKIGRCVRYRRSDLDAFLESCVVGRDADGGNDGGRP
jgi:excisionase family DNA binding protein